MDMRFNGDTAGNYDVQTLFGSAASAGAFENFAQTSITTSLPDASCTANLFGAVTVDISNYANSANNKCALIRGAVKLAAVSGSMSASRRAGFWRSNDAITQITITPATGNWVAGSRITLQGWP